MMPDLSSLKLPVAGALVALIGAIGLAPSCSEDDSAPDVRPDIVEAWTQDVLREGFDELVSESAALAANAQSFCDDPNEEALVEARLKWASARTALKRLEVFTFGPFEAYPERYGSALDFWPLRRDSIDDLLTSDVELTAETMAIGSAATRGFPATEYVLWPEVASASDAVDWLTAEPRRCAYLTAATADLAHSASGLRAKWFEEVTDEGIESTAVALASGRAPYEGIHDSLGIVVNEMGHLVENIRFQKLADPLGPGSGLPAPELAESQPSGHSLEDIRANLDGIERLYRGAEGSPGLRNLLESRGHDFDADFDEAIAKARAGIDAIGLPVPAAVEEKPGLVDTAMADLQTLQVLIQVDIIGALSLTLTFNDNDGD